MFGRILPFTKPYWRRIALIAVFIAAMAGINQIEPFITKRVTDLLVERANVGAAPANLPLNLSILLLAFLASKLIASGLNRLTWYWTNLFAVEFESHLKQVGFQHLMQLSMGFFNDQSTGKMMSKLDRGVNRLVTIVNNSGMHFLPSVTTAIVSAAIVTSYEWRITASIILAFVPYVLINRWRFLRNSQLEKQEYKLYDKQYSHFWEVLSSMSLIKSFRAERFEMRRLSEFFNKYISLRSEMEQNTNKAVAGDLFLETWNWAMYAYIAWMTWQGQISVGTMVLLISLIRMIREPLWQLNWIFWEVKRAGIGARDFFRIMDVQPDVVDPKNPVELKKVRGKIEFDHVAFTYQNHSEIADSELEDEAEETAGQGPQTVFEDVTFTILPGKTTALVGPSGSGKTTIAQLLMRYFDPSQGAITLDGVDLRNLRQADLRAQIGIVSQDSYLFADSIRENLRYAKPNATEDEMRAACRAAYADEFINNLPAGLDTHIGDRGVKLSGGQRQRLSIARTILLNPKIIILDEATSALDSESEMYIQRALEKVLAKRTAVVIAHRLSTIQRADQIIVLKDRKVLESGTHEALIEKDGLYAGLFKIQSGHTEAYTQKLKEWELVG